jgi:hypothetical protein
MLLLLLLLLFFFNGRDSDELHILRLIFQVSEINNNESFQWTWIYDIQTGN